ncbi:polysaccharide deacetylase family protein [Bizionia gelidisalsuginis]|uniref:Polysaccharide deacetylase family protein n=1 Tax=Bizionia gelidisalsuginis TaxID=291188 RepID=A0ABY3MCC5_9FLAO|nr:polysaccharide deacetylase family protein [Bizionia gelidisalsuginis]TYC15549.1 polysaccharide deacetylase family protein [Bizionia gelidisalsuginis]
MINFKLYVSFFSLFCCLIIVFITLELISIWWLVLYLFFGFIILGIASLTMRWDWFTKAFIHLKTTKKVIAITFDDGPNPEFTPQVLALLKQYNAKATFFCIGRQIEKHPDLLKAITNDGHAIGNHSYSHSKTIGFSTKKSWLKEIERTDALIKQTTGRQTKLFRPPFGVTTPHLASALKTTNHTCVGWSNRSFDTFFKSPKTISKRVLKRIKPGGIILLHDNQVTCIPVLEHILQVLQSEHYTLVTTNDLLHEK